MRWRRIVVYKTRRGAAINFLLSTIVWLLTTSDAVKPNEIQLQLANENDDTNGEAFADEKSFLSFSSDENNNGDEEPNHAGNAVLMLLAALDDAGGALDRRYNNLSVGCSSRCSMSDDRALAHCWLSTLSYFEGVLVGLIRRIVTIQANIVIWQYKHGITPDFEALRAQSLNRLAALTIRRIKDKNRPLDRAQLRRIVDSFFYDVQVKAEAVIYGREKPPRALDCPRACEKHLGAFLWIPMQYFFVLSCALTAALLTFIVIAIIVLERRETVYEKFLVEDDCTQHTSIPSSVDSGTPTIGRVGGDGGGDDAAIETTATNRSTPSTAENLR